MKKHFFQIITIVFCFLLIGFFNFFLQNEKKTTRVEVSINKSEDFSVSLLPEKEMPINIDILTNQKVEESQLKKERRVEAVRAIYIPKGVLESKKGRERTEKILSETRINALIVDIKDSTGNVFIPQTKFFYPSISDIYVEPALEFLKQQKDKGIYLIGRIVVFQDPIFPKLFPDTALTSTLGGIWTDRKGLSFLDPQNTLVREYIVSLANDGKQFGFSEINFDYIRYPSDGKISLIQYNLPMDKNKSDIMEGFFKMLYQKVSVEEDTPISIDIFGDTIRIKGDPGIGQVYEKTLPYFDAVSPMVYPSHFYTGSYGLLEPAKHPRIVMEHVSKDINKRFDSWCVSEVEFNPKCVSFKNRPWIQDFSLGGSYGVSEVKGQIEALENEGITSWFIWNPSGRYTIEALK